MTSPDVTYSYVDCGAPIDGANLTVAGQAGVCAEVRQGCASKAESLSPKNRDDVREIGRIAHQAGVPDSVSNYDCAARPGRAVPVVTPGLARAQVVRLLPRPGVGVAPLDRVTLVHIDTIFWVATSVGRDLGTVRLLGQRVSLRARLQGVDWDFGDGSSGRSVGPGRVYSSADACRTVRCPDYFTHEYSARGWVRVVARLTWVGQFRVGAGRWQDIAQTVSLASPGVRVRVREAQAVLVPNP